MRQNIIWTISLAAALLLSSLASVTAAQAGTRHAVVKVAKKPRSEGRITLTFQAEGGQRQEVVVGVIRKMKPEEIARDVMKELRLALDDQYVVRMKDAKKVAVKSRKPVPVPFDLKISGQTVNGLSVVVRYKKEE